MAGANTMWIDDDDREYGIINSTSPEPPCQRHNRAIILRQERDAGWQLLTPWLRSAASHHKRIQWERYSATYYERRVKR